MVAQREVMASQLATMKEQTEAIKNSVAVAQESADAAKRNVAIVVSKERARVRIEPRKFTLNTSDGMPIHAVPFTLKVMGSTPAFIVDTRADVAISDSAEPATVTFDVSMSFPPVLEAGAWDKHAIIWQTLDFERIEAIRSGTAFVHFYGFVKYTDVFDERRTTHFRYIWKYNVNVHRRPGEESWGSRYTNGQPEDNEAT
jgi:hypothetical protein